MGEVGTRCCRVLMDSLTRCISGRSEDAIMPVMAVRAKTGTHQDELKRSVRGGDDAASRLLRRHKISSQGLTTPSVTSPHPLPPNPLPLPPGGKDWLSFPDYHHFQLRSPLFHGLFCWWREIVSNERLQPLWFPLFCCLFKANTVSATTPQGHGLLFDQGSLLELKM